MFRNYLKIAWRNLTNNKVYSALNIGGLAVGMACCLLITIYVTDELSFDRYHQKGDRIYRANLGVKFGGTEQLVATTSDMLGPTLKNDYPQVENYVRLYDAGPYLVKKVGTVNAIREEKILFADSTLFDVFTLPLVAGDPKTALSKPNAIVISEMAAQRHFAGQNPMGQMLTLDNKKTYEITGIMNDMPQNSHFRAEFFVSMRSLNYDWNSTLSNNFHSYILLRPDTNPADFNVYFNQIVQKYISPVLQKTVGSTIDELTKSGSYYRYSMIPLADIHLKAKEAQGLGINGDIQYVYIFTIVALFVLLIACINFMNLSTARSAKRAGEVGVRKVLGSVRYQLMVQFFAECVLLSFFALILALGLVGILLPFFNDIAGKSLLFSNLFNSNFALFILVLPLLVGLLAGSYPAVFLSSFEPVQVLKGRMTLKGRQLRNVLVVFQFATSIVLIVGTVIVYRQISFIQQKNIGYNKNQVLIINDAYALDKQAVAFKEDVLKLKGIENGTLSGYLPTPSNRNNTVMFPEGQIDQTKGVSIAQWDIDFDYISTLGMNIVQGRDFSKDYGTDSTGVLLNETAVKLFGFKDPLNNRIVLMGDEGTQQSKSYRVVGVVKDFHFESLKTNIGALCMMLKSSRGNVSFRLDTRADLKSTISQIEGLWNKMAPGQPFSYNFMDQSFNNVYKAEQRIGRLALAFAFFTILVACLGLFGLATFIAEQRTKEIGVRKVLGASVSSIVTLLSKDFLKLVVISIVIASPIAWWAMHRWLQDFAYKIDIEWWVFALAGLLAVGIALLTVSFQSIKAALMNPVKSLRSE